jgi:three-Cys-motif partner protein
MTAKKAQKRRKPEFGGRWTEQKLEAIEKYLPAYTTILTKSPAAQYLKTMYVDAFAGTGKMEFVEPDQESLFTAEEEAYLSGSARRALSTRPEFNKYIFVDNNTAKRKHLERLKQDFPDKSTRIEVHTEDANSFLLRLCATTDWSKWRAVVFLDPFAMSVPWSTVEAIAATKAIDLWYLFPCGAFNRLLTRKGKPPAKWSEALTRICGTTEWESRFYQQSQQEDLFGRMASEEKVTGFEGINNFFHERLQSVFTRVAAKPLVLVNSRKVPIFMLFFAAGNPKGSAPAINIANWIIEHGGDENKYRMD